MNIKLLNVTCEYGNGMKGNVRILNLDTGPVVAGLSGGKLPTRTAGGPVIQPGCPLSDLTRDLDTGPLLAALPGAWP